ncbi:hypothetical protein WK77_16085 [Burkholderia ubonensis]|nr:hypothetical protein WK77_16085 [Burkholderia ubonensis]
MRVDSAQWAINKAVVAPLATCEVATAMAGSGRHSGEMDQLRMKRREKCCADCSVSNLYQRLVA